MTRDDSHALITILNAYNAYQDNDQKKGHIRSIIEALNALPPHIPIAYINRYLISSTGEYNIEHCLVQLKAIQKAGEHWCAFMHDRNWIQSPHEFKHPAPQQLPNVDDMLACFDGVSPERSSIFFETIKPFLSLDVLMIQRLAGAFSNGFIVDKEALNQVLHLADMIFQLPDDVSQVYMREQFLALLAVSPEQLTDPQGRFRSFVESVNQQAIPMERTAIKKLWEAWSTHRIQDLRQLRHSIQVVQWAQHAKGNPQRLDDLFLSMDSNKTQRQAIMQHLQHDLLDLGGTFKTSCYDKYQTLAEQLPGVGLEYNIKARLADLRRSFLSMMKWAQEVMMVATHPFQVPVAPANPGHRGRLHVHSLFFARQRDDYANTWWVSSARRGQADTLFDNLNTIWRANPSSADYYHQVLQAIWASQRAMLLQDKICDRDAYFYKSNTKGFSRLHDISMQMFARVARDFLADAVLTIQEKQGLNAILQAQLVFYINELEERLPVLNPLKEEITRIKNLMANRAGSDLWDPDSIELGLLKTAIETNRETLPKHLHYLLLPIDLATELSIGHQAAPLQAGPP